MRRNFKMATFGSYGNQNQISPTLYGYSLFNKDSAIDKTMMSFSMWKTTIKMAIYPLIESDDDQIKYDRKNGIAIYLTPQKAMMFAQILKEFRDKWQTDDLKKVDNSGIVSGQSLVAVCSPQFFNKDPKTTGPSIVVRRVTDDGHVEASYAYECKVNFYNAIRDYDEKTGKYKQDFTQFNNVELDTIIMQLESYFSAMTNTVAFTVAESLYPTLDKIASKLGVDLNSNYNGGQYKSNSYFGGNGNNNKPQQQNPGTAGYTTGSLEGLLSS